MSASTGATAKVTPGDIEVVRTQAGSLLECIASLPTQPAEAHARVAACLSQLKTAVGSLADRVGRLRSSHPEPRSTPLPQSVISRNLRERADLDAVRMSAREAHESLQRQLCDTPLPLPPAKRACLATARGGQADWAELDAVVESVRGEIFQSELPDMLSKLEEGLQFSLFSKVTNSAHRDELIAAMVGLLRSAGYAAVHDTVRQRTAIDAWAARHPPDSLGGPHLCDEVAAEVRDMLFRLHSYTADSGAMVDVFCCIPPQPGIAGKEVLTRLRSPGEVRHAMCEEADKLTALKAITTLKPAQASEMPAGWQQLLVKAGCDYEAALQQDDRAPNTTIAGGVARQVLAGVSDAPIEALSAQIKGVLDAMRSLHARRWDYQHALEVRVVCPGLLCAAVALPLAGVPEPALLTVLPIPHMEKRAAWTSLLRQLEVFKAVQAIGMRAIVHFTQRAAACSGSVGRSAGAGRPGAGRVGPTHGGALQDMLLWLCTYRSLFSQPCSATGKLLVLDSSSTSPGLLPPFLRPFRISTSALRECVRQPDLVKAYHVYAAPDGTL